MSAVKKLLHSDFKIIRKYYKAHLNEPDSDENTLWLTDNFYLLSREYTALNKALLKNNFLENADISGEIFSSCREILADGRIPDENAIISFLSARRITVRELQYLPFFFSFTLIHICADAVKQGNGSVKNVIISLRRLSELDFDGILISASETEKILMLDPSGDYANMDKATKELYRESVSETAIKEHRDEKSVAVEAYEKALSAPDGSNHIGFYLNIDRSRKKTGNALLICEIILPAVICVTLSVIYKSLLPLIFLFFPMWEILKTPFNILSSFLSKTIPLPRMETDEKIPDCAKTAVTVSVLLPNAPDADKLENKLSELYRSIPKKNTLICLLADLKSSNSPTSAADAADINAAKRVIDKLNKRFGGGFLLLVRPRIYSTTQREYSGFERKRGAIGALCSLICSNTNEFSVIYGDQSQLYSIKYILAADYDTMIPSGALAKLTAAAIHPLNRAVVSIKEKRVMSGYGIFAPKIETSIPSSSKTLFSRIMSPGSGVSAYNGLAGEKYQDLFSESIFSGKGLIDVRAFNAVIPGRFPNQRILSHDILEGIVLRCAFVGDVSFTDSFPKNVRSYYARNHRWMRGDIQNIPFLKFKKSKITDSVFDFSQRFRLFDNVRRAITPIAVFAALLISCFTGGRLALLLSSTAVLSVCASELFSFIFAAVRGGALSFSRLYASDCAPYALSCLLRGAADVIMLPYSFIDSLDAVLRSLYRMLISKKNLLEWTTFAASDNSKADIKSILKNIFAVLSGIFFVFAAVSPGKAAGIAFIFAPVFTLISGKPAKSSHRPLSESERNTVISYMSLTWNFYSKYCVKSENMLPPDNVQETPVFRISHRTSPTDIGMYAASCLCARDMNFISSEELCTRLDGILDSMDKMEKYRGNLLNWYDTRTLATLSPRYVSTVDSGNLVCCFAAIAEGLDGYIPECSRLITVKNRLLDFIKNCDLSFLYNSKRELFHIGYDVANSKLSESYYDLLMSEARMTGYYAAASGQVPLRHWASLGRMMVGSGRYAGPVSWTGTMFEYFMPALFIPTYENTLQSEGLKFALRCQKKLAAEHGIPYGISESGYYAFDRELNYLYKAHGAGSLSLKKTDEKELVISPYSTFISMEYDTASSLKNLKRLEDLGLRGECGFYEAVDFTKGRTLSQDFAIVRSYMAHHAGMTIIACNNLLNNGIMRHRFMADENNAGAKSLLEEKIPTDIRIMKRIYSLENAPKPPRRRSAKATVRPAGISSVAVSSSTNSEWTMITASDGESVSVYAGKSIFKKCSADLRAPGGIFACVQYEEQRLPFTPAPDFSDSYRHIFSSDRGAVKFETGDAKLTLSDERFVHPKYPAQISSYSIKNVSQSKLSLVFKLYFEPSLMPLSQFDTHPAYSALFLNADYDEKNSSFIFSRLRRETGSALYLACGFLSKTDFDYSFDREKALPHPAGYSSLFAVPVEKNTVSPDKCGYIETNITLSPGETKKLDFAFCASASRETAQEILSSVRRAQIKKSKCAPSLFDDESLSGIYANKLLANIFFTPLRQKTVTAALQRSCCAEDVLWSMGISADAPIISVKMTDDDNSVLPCIRMHSILSRCGIDTLLAVIASEPDEYSAPMKKRLAAILKSENYTHMLGAKNGVFYINSALVSDGQLLKLIASSSLVLPLSSNDEKVRPNAKSLRILNSNRVKNANNAFTPDGFEINRTPPVPWCTVLANQSFGTLVSESSLGFTWAINSGENKLTAWNPDGSSDNNSERMFIKIGSKIFDIIKGGNALFKKNSVEYSSRVRSLTVHTTVSVPERGMIKAVCVRITNSSSSDIEYEIISELHALLGADMRTSKFVKTKISDGRAIFSNPSNRYFSGFAEYSSDISDPKIITGIHSVQFGSLPGNQGDIIIKKKIRLPAHKTEIYKFYLTFGKTKAAAHNVIFTSPAPKAMNEITITTPDKSLNALVNTFLPMQIINSRLYGRTGYRQCSGAYGFRDQLQDALSVLLLNPGILKTQLFRCAAAQFTEGDVFHWFHVFPTADGVKLFGSRTRYSDDLLWLPYCAAQYVIKTGDASVLSCKLPFISGEPLNENENQRCFEARFTTERVSLYTHCIKAIDRSLQFGDNSLPLMMGGDWNDSFNEVGIKSKGESVWLAMFLIKILEDFSAVCLMLNDKDRAAHYAEIRVKLIRSVEENAWEGDRYLRAFYDSGEPMGSKFSSACKIDILTQAFSVLSNMPKSKRQSTALNTAYSELCDKENSIIKLFCPPFTPDTIRAGYVNDYPPGIRENSGQYTHAAVWLADAFFKLGEADRGYELINMINPARKRTSVFKNEPFFLSADVYTANGMVGRGGWSLYTGSAGWFYTTVVEDMLGVKLSGGCIKKEPCLPEELRGSRADIKIGLNYGGGAYNPQVS